MAKIRKRTFYKYCIVPLCTNTGFKTPDKVFITLPSNKDAKRRRAWLTAMGRNPADFSNKTTAFVCEDHFDLEQDVENYIRFKYAGGRILIKHNVLPHVFHCQPDRKRNTFERPASIRRARCKLLAEMMEDEPPRYNAEDREVAHKYVTLKKAAEQKIDSTKTETESQEYSLTRTESDSTKTEIESQEYSLTGDDQDILPHISTFKLEPEDIKIEEPEIEDVDYVVAKIENDDDEMHVQETNTLNQDVHIEYSAAASTYIPPLVNTSAALTKQAIQSKWKNIIKNTLATTSKEFAPEQAEEEDSIRNTIELCVLCAKDVSKLRHKKSVTEFLDMILLVTGVDVTQYKISPFACGGCYKFLFAIKGFQKQVNEAKVLILKKLPHVIENEKLQEIEFLDTNNHNIESLYTSEVNDQAYIKTEEPEEEVEVFTIQVIDGDSFPQDPELLSVCNTESNTESTINQVETVKHYLNIKQRKKYKSNKNISKYKPKIKSKSLLEMPCYVCGKMVIRGSFYKHMQMHKNIRVSCKKCGKLLKSVSLSAHMRNHENQGQQTERDKCICSDCGKSYTRLSGLRRHQITHGDKKHICRICNQSFHFLSYLARHMRSHSGEKPYACVDCDRTFSILWNYRQHRRLHTNNKPYKCQLCSAAFRHNVTLKGHIVKAHSANEVMSVNENGVMSVNENDVVSVNENDVINNSTTTE